MNRQELRAFALLVLALVAVAIFGVFRSAHAGGPPPQAERYRATLVRSAQYVYGLNAPIAILAAQVHQESGWNTAAKSAYASGLAQFTPATAKTMAALYPQDLRDPVPTDPRWALLALCRYDKQLYAMWPRAVTDSDRWAFTLSAYNGGAGWTMRDRAKAKALGMDSERWWESVETVNAGRAPQFKRENTDYPRRILLLILPVYVKAGWGQGVAP